MILFSLQTGHLLPERMRKMSQKVLLSHRIQFDRTDADQPNMDNLPQPQDCNRVYCDIGFLERYVAKCFPNSHVLHCPSLLVSMSEFDP